MQNFSFAFEMQSGNNSVRISNGSAVLFATEVVAAQKADIVNNTVGQATGIAVLCLLFAAFVADVVVRKFAK